VFSSLNDLTGPRPPAAGPFLYRLDIGQRAVEWWAPRFSRDARPERPCSETLVPASDQSPSAGPRPLNVSRLGLQFLTTIHLRTIHHPQMDADG
jgi:hypothetical protein